MKRFSFGLFIIAGLLGVLTVLSTFYTINERERGVVLRNGAVVGVADPGFHFAVPLVTTVKTISLETKIVLIDNEDVYSRDQQPATMRLSVNYSINPTAVTNIYTRFGSLENLEAKFIRPRIFEKAKTIFGGYTAVSSVQDRGKLNTDIRMALTDALNELVNVEGVQVEDVSYGAAYEKAIAARMDAEVKVQQENQNWAREKVLAQIAVTQAQAIADSQLAKAKANAEAVRLEGEATADAIRARAKALQDNPGLIELTKAERWNGVLPTTMLPNSAVPFLNK